MKITIDLKDKTKCEGCPCFSDNFSMVSYKCGLGYFKEKHHIVKIRPQECIKENGE